MVSPTNRLNESTLAILIDYENVGLDAIEFLLDQLSDVGRAIVKRAYADWSTQSGKRDQLLELGIEAIHVFRSSRSGKNSSDIRLTIDAVEVLYGSPVDTFVIVSSDSDFVPLVSKLRAAGKVVIGAGRRDATSATLVKSCDRYVYLDDVKAASEKEQPPQDTATTQRSLVVRALEASIDDRGQVIGSKLHQTMQRIDPSFNYRTMGHRTFTQFLAACDEVVYEHPDGAGDVIVRLSQSQDNGVGAPANTALASGWDREIDAAWNRRQRRRLSGQAAAGDAAKALGVPRLTASRFPSLDKLLDASPLLRGNWRREGNAIIKR
ncbi:MAG: NYN domain-containing protein [Chloroflexi bacterium]|nr:NYN domain-containing protein [Chloroflexota bacterium]